MGQKLTVSVDQVARAAGYIMMPPYVEAGARKTILEMHPNNEAKGREQLRMGVSMGTGGIILSEWELTQYIAGEGIRQLLANRLMLTGDIKTPYVPVTVSPEEEAEARMQIDIIEGRVNP